MSFPYYPNLLDEKIESLETQHEFLNILRLRHLQWMSSADNPEIGVLHRQIAGLLEQMNDHYAHLLEDLRLPPS